MTRIGHPRALIGTFIPTADAANLLKMEFFDAVAYLKPDFAELSYVLDQGGQMRIHQWFYPLSLDDWREPKFILP
jgi:hypothetical protein